MPVNYKNGKGPKKSGTSDPVAPTTPQYAQPGLQEPDDDQPIFAGFGGQTGEVEALEHPVPASPEKPESPVAEDEPQPKKQRSDAGKKRGQYVKVNPATDKNMRRPYTPDELDKILEDSGVPRNDELVSKIVAQQMIAQDLPGETREDGKRLRVRASKEAVDFRRKQILRLMLRGVPTMTIAEHLGLTIRLVYEDKAVITREMREELRQLDYPTYIGMSMAFYDEVRNQLLRVGGDQKESMSNRIRALTASLMAEKDKHELMNRVGLFKISSPTDPMAEFNSGRSGHADESEASKFLSALMNASQIIEGESQDVGSQ